MYSMGDDQIVFVGISVTSDMYFSLGWEYSKYRMLTIVTLLLTTIHSCGCLFFILYISLLLEMHINVSLTIITSLVPSSS